jgi:hypothetical protein
MAMFGRNIMGLRTKESLLPFSYKDVPIESASRGYIYAMSNTELSGLMKLGFSERSPIDRMNELNRQTANPGRFVPEFWFLTLDAAAHERRLFEALNYARVRTKKEFLRLDAARLCVYISWYFGREPDFIQQTLMDSYAAFKMKKRQP